MIYYLRLYFFLIKIQLFVTFLVRRLRRFLAARCKQLLAVLSARNESFSYFFVTSK
jgi:hypothetical protein